jgi:hypothetical protein
VEWRRSGVIIWGVMHDPLTSGDASTASSRASTAATITGSCLRAGQVIHRLEDVVDGRRLARRDHTPGTKDKIKVRTGFSDGIV